MVDWTCDDCGKTFKVPEGSSPRCGCKQPRPEGEVSVGLGDTIAKVTTAMGIKPCGKCKKRQEALNKAFPYKKKDGKL